MRGICVFARRHIFPALERPDATIEANIAAAHDLTADINFNIDALSEMWRTDVAPPNLTTVRLGEECTTASTASRLHLAIFLHSGDSIALKDSHGNVISQFLLCKRTAEDRDSACPSVHESLLRKIIEGMTKDHVQEGLLA